MLTEQGILHTLHLADDVIRAIDRRIDRPPHPGDGGVVCRQSVRIYLLKVVKGSDPLHIIPRKVAQGYIILAIIVAALKGAVNPGQGCLCTAFTYKSLRSEERRRGNE